MDYTNNSKIPIKLHDLYKDQQFTKKFNNSAFKYFMKVPKDGNCLYSSISRHLFFLAKKDCVISFLNKKDLLLNANYPELVYESYFESISDALKYDSIDQISDYEWSSFIAYLRSIVSSHLLTNKTIYENNCTELTNVEDYVKKNVEPMGKRAGELEIISICKELGIDIVLIIFTYENIKEISYGNGPKIYILHTPDHFEPLFY